MGSGRGDRNQGRRGLRPGGARVASMGSGRGDRNQLLETYPSTCPGVLQWGPVVVTGISGCATASSSHSVVMLQWGPVVVTGISEIRLSSACES